MRSKSKTFVTFAVHLVVLFAALCSGGTALGQEVPHPFQLSFGANALSYERTKTSIDGDSATATSADLGPEASGFSVSLGGRPSESWLVGLTLHGSHSRVTDGRDGTPSLTRSAYAVMPRLEYWFAPGDAVSPYAGATLGLRGGSTSAGPGAKASTSEFAIGGLAGIRVFATPGFSVDPNLALLAVAGSGEANGTKLDRSGFTFVLGVSLSGWLGADPPVAAPIPQKLSPATTPTATPAPRESTTSEPPAVDEPPPLLVDHDADGTLRAEVWLTDGLRLRVMGRPNHKSDSVLVTLLNGTPTGNPAKACTELNVVVDGRSHAIVPGPKPVAGSAAVQVLMTPAALLAIGDAKQSAQLNRCGTNSEIVGEGRHLLGEFYREFRTTAERYGRRVPEALAE